MRGLLKVALGRLGVQLKRASADHIVRQIDEAREVVRLSPDDPLTCQHTLERLALVSKLGHLIRVHRPDLVVDVGANRGQFVDQLRAIGYTGPVVSLEPQAALAAALHARASVETSNWIIIRGAAGESESRMTLHTFTDDTFTSLHQPNQTAHTHFGPLLSQVAAEEVEVRRLDSWLAEIELPAASRIFLKVDTQGHDLAVLKGATQTLARTVVVMAEGAFIPLYDTGSSAFSLADALVPHGFKNAGIYASAHDRGDFSAIEADCLFTRPAKELAALRDHEQPACALSVK